MKGKYGRLLGRIAQESSGKTVSPSFFSCPSYSQATSTFFTPALHPHSNPSTFTSTSTVTSVISSNKKEKSKLYPRQRRRKLQFQSWLTTTTTASLPFLLLLAHFSHSYSAKQLGAEASLLPISQQPAAASSVSSQVLTDFDGATFYKAPVGARVRIACNGSHWSEDAVSLVLWFKGAALDNSGSGSASQEGGGPAAARHSVPIYTLDARHRSPSQGARHLVADAYKGRAKFVTSARPPYLDLFPLEPGDQAEYRCRIDYRARPRENFLLILFVLVPPTSVQVMDSSGRSLEQIYGPLSEDSDLTLVCVSKGGRPAPAVRWKRAKQTLDRTYLTLSDFRALERAKRLPAILANSSGGSSDAADWLAEWRRWPEFEYFSSPGTLGEHRKSPDGSGEQVGVTGAGTRDEWPLPAPHLLTLEVPGEMTTAVNVLKLSNLGQLARDSSGPSAAHPSESHSPNSGAVHLPELECEASNLHYDLRSLIKLFVPSSLQVAAYRSSRSGSELTGTTSSSGISRTSRTDLSGALAGERQLVAAIDQALEVALLTSSSAATAQVLSSQIGPSFQQQADDHTARRTSAEWGANLHSDEREGGKSSQQTLLMSRQRGETLSGEERSSSAHQDSGGQERIIDNDKQGSPSAARMLLLGAFQQLLERPHQLSDSLDLSSQSSSSSSAPNQPHETRLVRSRLIALDIYRKFPRLSLKLPSSPRSDLLQLTSQTHQVRPLDVRISLPNAGRALTAGQLAEFSCQASGSRPQATLSWWRQGERLAQPILNQLNQLVLHQQNGEQLLSSSKLTIRLDRLDHGKELTCRAENELLERLTGRSYTIQDSRLLSVQYAPRVKLELGNRMLSTQIREATDIYFECQVDAQPPVKEIAWLHNGNPINATSSSPSSDNNDNSKSSLNNNNNNNDDNIRQDSSNIFVSNNSLVLQRVRIKQRGQYACIAFNSEGVTESNRIELRVLHAPTCAAPRIGERSGTLSSAYVLAGSKQVALNSRVQLECPMEAEPARELEISWYMNNSQAERRELSAWTSVTTTLGSIGVSRFEFSPESALDYGYLYCIARNSLGEQKRPCVYEILPALTTTVQGNKETSSECSAATADQLNVSSMGVACGPTQMQRTGKSESPEEAAAVSNLRPATQYTLITRQDQDHERADYTESTSLSGRNPSERELTEGGGLQRGSREGGAGGGGSVFGSMFARLSSTLGASGARAGNQLSLNKLMENETLASLLCVLLILAAGSLTMLLLARKLSLLKLRSRGRDSAKAAGKSGLVGLMVADSGNASQGGSRELKEPAARVLQSTHNNILASSTTEQQQQRQEAGYAFDATKDSGFADNLGHPDRSQSVRPHSSQATSVAATTTATRAADHVGLAATNQSPPSWTMSSTTDRLLPMAAATSFVGYSGNNFRSADKQPSGAIEAGEILGSLAGMSFGPDEQEEGEGRRFGGATLERCVNLPDHSAIIGAGFTFTTASSHANNLKLHQQYQPPANFELANLNLPGLAKSRSAFGLESLAATSCASSNLSMRSAKRRNQPLISTNVRLPPITCKQPNGQQLELTLSECSPDMQAALCGRLGSFDAKGNSGGGGSKSAKKSQRTRTPAGLIKSNEPLTHPLRAANHPLTARTSQICPTRPTDLAIAGTMNRPAPPSSVCLKPTEGGRNDASSPQYQDEHLISMSLSAADEIEARANKHHSLAIASLPDPVCYEAVLTAAALAQSNCANCATCSSTSNSTFAPSCLQHDYSSEHGSTMHFIELLPQLSSTTNSSSASNHQQCLLDLTTHSNLQLPTDELLQQEGSHQQQYTMQQQQQHLARQQTLKCPSFTSSGSIAFSSVKDQSPLSLTNTTLSSTDNQSLLYNFFHPSHHNHHHHHQQQRFQYSSSSSPNSHDNNNVSQHQNGIAICQRKDDYQLQQQPDNNQESFDSSAYCMGNCSTDGNANVNNHCSTGNATDSEPEREQNCILYAQENQANLSNGSTSLLPTRHPHPITSILKNSNSKSRYDLSEEQQQQHQGQQLHNVCQCNDNQDNINLDEERKLQGSEKKEG